MKHKKAVRDGVAGTALVSAKTVSKVQDKITQQMENSI
jgi:hypothetical protein